MMLPGRFLFALLLLLTGCAQAPPPPPPEGLQSLEKARQLLSAGQPVQAAEEARHAVTFLEVQDRPRVPQAKAVLAESLVQLKDYPTALKYYREAAASDARAYGPPLQKLCGQLAKPKLEAARKHLARAAKGTSFQRTNALLEAGEALGQAQELLAAGEDRPLQAEADRLAGQLAKERNRILPSARAAPRQRRKDPFGGGKATAARASQPIFTRPWSPPLPKRQGELELTEFVVSPGLLGVSRVRGTVVNHGASPARVEVHLKLLAEETWRGLMDSHPEVLADERSLAQRASAIPFSLGTVAAGASRTFEEKVETGLPVDVSLLYAR